MEGPLSGPSQLLNRPLQVVVTPLFGDLLRHLDGTPTASRLSRLIQQERSSTPLAAPVIAADLVAVLGVINGSRSFSTPTFVIASRNCCEW